jgi:hypothetical protein
MKRGRASLLLALAPLLLAAAVDVSTIASQLELRHYYVEPGTGLAINDMEGLVAAHPGVNFVALASETPEGADALAWSLLQQLGEGTVVVLTPSEVGAVSLIYDDAALAAALDAATADSGSYLDDFREFAGALPAAPPARGGSPVALIVVLVIVGLIGVAIWNGNRRRSRQEASRLAEARTEIRAQMDVVANEILQLADDPQVQSNEEARAHYRAATEAFDSAEQRLAAASTIAALEDLSDDLDKARWDLEAATAKAAGRQPPPFEEERPHCFFDPTHGAGVEEAELQTAAGTQKVWVCREDAEKLRQGQQPDPRPIPVGDRPIPAPQAPRSHGGLGLDWLDAFSIIVGGMGRGMPYDWSQSRPGRRSPMGGRGGGGGSRPPSPTSRPAPPSRPVGRGRRSR